jgi:hypothetical protein
MTWTALYNVSLLTIVLCFCAFTLLCLSVCPLHNFTYCTYTFVLSYSGLCNWCSNFQFCSAPPTSQTTTHKHTKCFNWDYFLAANGDMISGFAIWNSRSCSSLFWRIAPTLFRTENNGNASKTINQFWDLKFWSSFLFVLNVECMVCCEVTYSSTADIFRMTGFRSGGCFSLRHPEVGGSTFSWNVGAN